MSVRREPALSPFASLRGKPREWMGKLLNDLGDYFPFATLKAGSGKRRQMRLNAPSSQAIDDRLVIHQPRASVP